MSNKGKKEVAPEDQVTVDPEVKDEVNPGTGMKIRKAFMLRMFLPDANWIAREVTAKGKGTTVMLGRVFGICTGFERKMNTVGDKVIPSISIRGNFQAENYFTGEVSESASVYLPGALAEKLVTMFEGDENLKTIEIDTDIGVEATGKTIPYAWTATQWIDGDKQNPLARLKSSRKRPDNAALLKSGYAIAQLAAPSK
jgi:hypothetical protein